MLQGASVAYHPNPMDAKTIGELAGNAPGEDADQHADVLHVVPAPVHEGAVRQPQVRDRRRREAAAAAGNGVSGAVRRRSARGLRLHGDGAGRRGQSSRTSSTCKERQIGTKPGSVGHPIPGVAATDRGPGDRRRPDLRPRGPAARQRTEPDDRLPRPARQNRRSHARRLVRHGRHREDGRGRVHLHHGPALALQQDRRRDGAAREDRGSDQRRARRFVLRRHGGARSVARRTAGRVPHARRRHRRGALGAALPARNCRACGCHAARTFTTSRRFRRSARAKSISAGFVNSRPSDRESRRSHHVHADSRGATHWSLAGLQAAADSRRNPRSTAKRPRAGIRGRRRRGVRLPRGFDAGATRRLRAAARDTSAGTCCTAAGCSSDGAGEDDRGSPRGACCASGHAETRTSRRTRHAAARRDPSALHPGTAGDAGGRGRLGGCRRHQLAEQDRRARLRHWRGAARRVTR